MEFFTVFLKGIEDELEAIAQLNHLSIHPAPSLIQDFGLFRLNKHRPN